MSRHLEGIEAAEERGRVLLVLQVAYPRASKEDVIRAALTGSGSETDRTEVREHLTYLQGKGLAEVDVREDTILNTGKHWMAKLTPLGMDLLQGAVPPVPGVTLP